MPTSLHKPLYIQIQEYLADKILKGDLRPEARVPSERELSEELGVSRMTVRRSLTELVNEGYLERRHGAGTFVAKPKVTYEAADLLDYAQAMRTRGLAVRRQLLELTQIPANRRLAECLRVDIGHSLYHVILLYLVNLEPVILENAFLSCERFPDLREQDLEKTSLYDLIRAELKQQVSFIEHNIEAVIASQITASQLHVSEGFPLLMISRTTFNAENQVPLQYSQDFLRSDYARLHNRLVIGEGRPTQPQMTFSQP